MASPMSLFKADIVLDGELSSTQAREKWERTAVDTARQANKGKIKGRAVYVHGGVAGKYVLYYYHNFGGDFCDTMFTGEIFEYDEGKCQVTGRITVSTSVKRFAAVLFALSIPLGILFELIIHHVSPYLMIPQLSPDFDYNNWLVFGGAFLAVNAIAVLCLCVDNRRVRNITDYLHEFLKE
jgi:hypothetical protein